jgi:hypothetical protein
MNSQPEEELSFDPLASFTALTGCEPYWWQRRLLEEYFANGDMPSAVDVPTGLARRW